MSSALPYKQLPLSERIQLVEDIWDSIAEETLQPPALSAEQRAELQRRLSEQQTDPSSGIPWEQARSALFKSAG